MPSLEKIREIVCDAIARTMQLSGHARPKFSDEDKPIGDYDGFDSQCGLEVTVEIEARLGIPDLGNNVFIKGSGKRAAAKTLSEIVIHIKKLLKRE